jgi:hypothetical protein
MTRFSTSVVRITRTMQHRIEGWSQPVLPPDDQRRFTAEQSGGGSGHGAR